VSMAPGELSWVVRDFYTIPTKTSVPLGLYERARQIAPGESLGTPDLTLTDFKTGTDLIVIRESTGDELAFANQATAPHTFQVPYYGPGASQIRIRAVKQGYKVVDFLFNLPQFGASLPILQEVDRAYST